MAEGDGVSNGGSDIKHEFGVVDAIEGYSGQNTTVREERSIRS